MPLAVPVPALAARLAGLRLPHADGDAEATNDTPARSTPPRSVVLLYQLPAAVWARILPFLPNVNDLVAAAHALPVLHRSPSLAHCWSAALGRALAAPNYAARLALSALGGGGGRALDTPLLAVPLRAVAVHVNAHLVVLAAVAHSDANSDTEPAASNTSAVVSATVAPSPCQHGSTQSDPRAAVLALDLVQTSVWWSLRMTLACTADDAREPDAAHAHRVLDYTHTGPYLPTCDNLHVVVGDPNLPRRRHSVATAEVPPTSQPIYGPAVGGTRGECVYRATVAETVTRTHRVLDVDLAPMVVSFAHLARFFTDVSVPDPREVAAARAHLATAGYTAAEWTPVHLPNGTIAAYCATCFPTHTAPMLCAALEGTAVPSPAATPNRWMRPLAKLKAASGIVEVVDPAIPRVSTSPPCQRVRARPSSAVEPGKASATAATWSMGGVLAAAAATRRLVVGGWRRLTDSDSASLHGASHF
ncbi:hypothetical protein GGF31_007677 [Allomyces arbusculus]|nr:hypothetical protein GGF31_007677 [Allomyces arbusculus]